MDTMVSVICTAYNHERYIRKTLQSFIDQKTSFKIEVLVNDDASTDKTADIIREFEDKYPEIIKPIYQTENQYSQDIDILREILLPRAKGKYIAFCEGDDYWIDPLKLQKQIDYMEAHPRCTLCVHNAMMINEQGKPIGRDIVSRKSRGISIEEVLTTGVYPTASVVTQRRLCKEFPDYFDIFTLDSIWQMYFASEGEVYCFAEDMSAYRVNALDSWTSKYNSAPAEQRIPIVELHIKVRKAFDKSTNYRYHQSIEFAIQSREIDKYILEVNTGELKDKRLNKTLSKLPWKIKVKVWLVRYIPSAYKFIADRRGWAYVH